MYRKESVQPDAKVRGDRRPVNPALPLSLMVSVAHRVGTVEPGKPAGNWSEMRLSNWCRIERRLDAFPPRASPRDRPGSLQLAGDGPAPFT